MISALYVLLENWCQIAQRLHWKCSVTSDEIYGILWSKPCKDSGNKRHFEIICVMNEKPRELFESGKHYSDFLLQHGKESHDVVYKAQHRVQLFHESLRRIQDMSSWRYGEFCSIGCADHRWRILFALVLLAVNFLKMLKAADCICLLVSKNTAYTCMLDC